MRRLIVVLVACSATACEGGARADGEDTPPDSAVRDGAALLDSAALPDGAARDSTARRDTIIGRDSAFGPTHTIDASGKITPIDRRPPQRRGDTLHPR